MTRAPTPTVYRGVVIIPRSAPGFALRYSARLDTGERLTANTLVEIKAAIRDALAEDE